MAAKKYHNTEDFVKQSISIHGNKYSYDKTVFTGLQNKIIYTCSIHGDISQRAASHLKGHGCEICNKTCSTDNWILKAKKVHGDIYDYGKVKYIHSEDYVLIGCKIHGDFNQLACSHLQGTGCPECGKLSKSEKCTTTQSEFKSKSNIKHNGYYDYSKSKYINQLIPVIINCPIHGDFNQTPQKHLLGSGCQECGKVKASDKNQLSRIDYIDKCIDIHGLRYDYSKVILVGTSEKVIIGCSIHGDFEQRASNHLLGQGCPFCNYERTTSISEDELFEYINIIYTDTIERNNRSILSDLSNENELDIYIPGKKIAIEFDGLYWHSELKKDKKYHLQKTENCLSKGIRLIHIFEDEWLNKKEIVKSRLSNLLGVTKNHYYARKTIVKAVGFSESKKFLEDNHIQGYCNSSIRLGLYYRSKTNRDTLIGLMTFGSLRNNVGSSAEDGHYELLRFCNMKDLNIVGGASKLLKHFIKNYDTKEIISYCDRRWSEGNLYEKLGFTLSHNSPINYYYIINHKRENRYGYRKDILISKYGCSKEQTEKEFCFDKKWYRIYDCGAKVYKMILN